MRELRIRKMFFNKGQLWTTIETMYFSNGRMIQVAWAFVVTFQTKKLGGVIIDSVNNVSNSVFQHKEFPTINLVRFIISECVQNWIILRSWIG